MSIYTITEYEMFNGLRTVQMSFQLPILDWCRFENSDVGKNLIRYLEELEKQSILSQPEEEEG